MKSTSLRGGITTTAPCSATPQHGMQADAHAPPTEHWRYFACLCALPPAAADDGGGKNSAGSTEVAFNMTPKCK